MDHSRNSLRLAPVSNSKTSPLKSYGISEPGGVCTFGLTPPTLRTNWPPGCSPKAGLENGTCQVLPGPAIKNLRLLSCYHVAAQQMYILLRIVCICNVLIWKSTYSFLYVLYVYNVYIYIHNTYAVILLLNIVIIIYYNNDWYKTLLIKLTRHVASCCTNHYESLWYIFKLNSISAQLFSIFCK